MTHNFTRWQTVPLTIRLGPFEFHGYPMPATSSGEAEFSTTSFTLSRIEMMPGKAGLFQ